MNNNAIAVIIENRFERFVAAVHDGRRPYQWQRRLVRTIIDAGRWPDRLSAPTGAGKTMVIDVHVFLNALAGLASISEGTDDPELVDAIRGLELERLPRRLAMTVNRRSLVDDQYDEALELKRIIREGKDESNEHDRRILALIRQGLDAREGGIIRVVDEPDSYDSLRVIRLRGGEPVSGAVREWRYRPTACQVICATPDMFGSRLLFSGYGTTPQARPIEAGLLAYDTVLVADEAHLSRQLVETARSVRRLERSGNDAMMRFSPLQVMSTTATQTSIGDESNVGVEESDFDVDVDLRERLTRPKPVEVVAGERKDLARAMAERCVAEYDENAVVGCIVNSVKMAEDVMKALNTIRKERKKAGEELKGEARAFVGPMRQYDKKRLVNSDLFQAMKGDEQAVEVTNLHYVIATQTLEVGIDADFCTLITELPAASALVQRVGRVNRRGKRDFGRVIVFRELDPSKTKKGVYSAEELEYASHWLETFEGADSGLSAWACTKNPPRSAELSRVALQRLELWDVENLSHTDEELAADMTLPSQNPFDINLWLRDDLLSQDDPNIGVVVRSLPENDADALGLLDVVRPVADEAFPIRDRGQIAEIEKRSHGGTAFRIFIVRARETGDNAVIPWNESIGSLVECLQSGDMLVVDSSAPLFDRNLHTLKPTGGECETDVYNLCQDSGVILSTADDGDGTLERILAAIRSNDVPDTSDTPDEDSSDLSVSDRDPCLLRNVLVDEIDRECLRRMIQSRMIGNAGDGHDPAGQKSVQEFVENYENMPTERFVFPSLPIEEEQPSWLVLQRSENSLDDVSQQEMRKTISGRSNDPVYLNTDNGHQCSVERRAERFLRILGLPAEIRRDVMVAARHHDDGKKDPRFQRLLHFRLREPQSYDDGTYLAKSRYYSPVYEARVRREMNLRGWRHEQRSAAECWADSDVIGANDIELVTRLAGTSHGHGRSCFRDNAETLIPRYVMEHADAGPAPNINDIRRAAGELFDDGVWERIISHTNERYGYWGVAYLEAILRAADVTISSEGR
ncbi:type I-G CRISPR-associated helicase/endonuclease Cas3g [Bifidobacterium callimiconis]|nr:type I-U CRISPR-associated helicase/endonuclease Cas3 [Bifidobacterium callimiconis]